MTYEFHVWVANKNKKAPKYSFLEYEGVDFGKGTENLSEDYEQHLYGEWMTISIGARFFET